MTIGEAAWVGAMIEGEGTVGRYGHGNSIRIVNTEVETIATVLRFVGDGRVYCRLRREGWHTAWSWTLANTLSLRRFLPQVIPWLTSKKEEAEAMLAEVSRA
jgi:hypothetical protein